MTKLRITSKLGVLIALVGAFNLMAMEGESESRAVYNAWTMPGISVGAPSGYGASFGQVFAGGGYVSRNRFGTDSDGAVGLGFGLGNPAKYVGLETSLTILDVSGFERGGVGLKLHRQLPQGFGVAVGRENLATWGGVSDQAKSWYGSVSKIFFLRDQDQAFSALTISAGVGDGRFRTATSEANNESTVNVFATAAVRVVQPVAFITEWSGQDLNLGLSITPFRKLPIFINPALLDVTQTAGDGARFSLGGGVAYTFGQQS